MDPTITCAKGTPRSCWRPSIEEPVLARSRQTLIFDDNHAAAQLYGEGDRSLRVVEEELGVEARARGNGVRLVGPAEAVSMARKVLEQLYAEVRAGRDLQSRDVGEAVRMVKGDPEVDLREVYEDVLAGVGSRRRIAAKTLSQKRYLEMIASHDLDDS